MIYIKSLFSCCFVRRREVPNITTEVITEEYHSLIIDPYQEESLNNLSYEPTVISESETRNVKTIIKEKNDTEKTNDQINIEISSNDSNIIETDDNKLLIPEKYIRPDELTRKVYSKSGMVNFFDELEKDTTWISLYNNNNLVLHYKKSSIFTEKFLLGKLKFTMAKSLFSKPFDIAFLVKTIYDPEMRVAYDKSIKEFKIFEEGEYYKILKVWYFSPLMFVSERDLIDKRVSFLKDGVYYSLASSLEKYENAPEDSKVIRIKNYINALKLSEDQDNFYFHCYSQLDAKMPIPESILNITIPMKSNEWYKNYINYIKRVIS